MVDVWWQAKQDARGVNDDRWGDGQWVRKDAQRRIGYGWWRMMHGRSGDGKSEIGGGR